jgi:uncharacterized membrane protein
MSLLSFAQWLQNTGFATALRGSWYVYPVVLSLHLVFIASFGGMIFVGNMRLLGLAFRSYSISDVVNQLQWPKRIGFLLVLTCGALLASSKAEEYYYNVFFWTKMTLLALIAVHGLIFRRSVYSNTAAIDKAPTIPALAKLAAGLSLLLWIGVAIAGRGIGYIEPPIEKLHALLQVPRHAPASNPR